VTRWNSSFTAGFLDFFWFPPLGLVILLPIETPSGSYRYPTSTDIAISKVSGLAKGLLVFIWVCLMLCG
jgi:hypothetical protein